MTIIRPARTSLGCLIALILTSAAPAADAPAVGDATAPTNCSKPVFMLVQGRTADRGRMVAYGRKLRDAGAYAKYNGSYAAAGRPIDIFEGAYPDDQTVIIAQFPCLARARQFWYSELYQREILPLREGAGRFSISVYAAQLPP